MTADRPIARHRRFRHALYTAFIEPKQTEPSLRNRELVFNVLLTGTGLLMSALLVLLLISYSLLDNRYVLGRVAVAAGGLLFILTLRWVSRRLSYYAAAYWLVGFYCLLAIGCVVAWDISTPFGIMLLGLIIILASTLLSSRHALYAAVLASAVVIIVALGNERGWLISQPPAGKVETVLGDAFGQAAVFAIIATISWLFGRGMENSLWRAETAEAELEREKAGLEKRVAQRTSQLKQAQIEEIRQIYRFVEVGQLSTALLHDLANYLTLFNLEIDSVTGRRNAETLARSREAIGQLNKMVDDVRDRLSKGTTKERYNIVSVINEAVLLSQYKKSPLPIQISWDPPRRKRIKDFQLYGDPIKCSQIITILLGNAIDAYIGKKLAPKEIPEIVITLSIEAGSIKIRITDWGVGIASLDRSKIFKPDFSTKKQGMGIGLYLARQMARVEFEGDVTLSSDQDRTEFVVSLPLVRGRHDR